ncbi:MAG: hypothetical protein K0R15_1054 [Clostridiales bacterium]|jgi:hypothetical protein|nr:hypothetical protein [Clostridiales bacterium]
MEIKVTQVYPMENYKLHVYFEDGRIKSFDASELITSGSFRALENIEVFIETCKVLNGNVVWDINNNGSKYVTLTAHELYDMGEKILAD